MQCGKNVLTKNNLPEQDRIRNGSRGNGTEMEAASVGKGQEQEKRHGNGNTNAFPCKTLDRA